MNLSEEVPLKCDRIKLIDFRKAGCYNLFLLYQLGMNREEMYGNG